MLKYSSPLTLLSANFVSGFCLLNEKQGNTRALGPLESLLRSAGGWAGLGSSPLDDFLGRLC